jgi:VWFA-related protein
MRLRCGILIALASGSLSAQAPEPGGEVRFQSDTRQVLVPVVVTDKKGHHVSGLQRTDFNIYEDSVLQAISGFSTEAAGSVTEIEELARSGPVPVAGPVVTRPPASAARRTYVICFDTLHSSFANFGHVREALEQLFKQDQSGGNAQYVMIALGRDLRVFQTATSDSATLRSKMRENTFLSVLSGVDAQAMANEVNAVRLRMEQHCRTCPCGPNGKGNLCFSERQVLRQEIAALSERAGLMTRGFPESLNSLIEELAKVPTNRSLILVSDGFSMVPGNEFFAVASAYLPNYGEFKFAPDQQMELLLQQSLDLAAKKNITIHTIDSRGLYSPSFAAGNAWDASVAGAGAASARNRGGSMLNELDRRQSSVAFQNSSGLAQLAAATGGMFFHDSNDMLKNFRTAIADGREYYVLSYTPKNASADGKFRKILVELRDKSLTARAKEGYRAN